MFDGTEETCWNSDEGDTQFVIIKFEQSIDLCEVRLHSQKAVSQYQQLYLCIGSHWRPQEVDHEN